MREIITEEDRFCETCGTALVLVGEEFIRTEIEFIPAKVRAIDYYRQTFECRTCRKNGEPYMEKSPHALSCDSAFHGVSIHGCVDHAPEVCECPTPLPVEKRVADTRRELKPCNNGQLDSGFCP